HQKREAGGDGGSGEAREMEVAGWNPRGQDEDCGGHHKFRYGLGRRSRSRARQCACRQKEGWALIPRILLDTHVVLRWVGEPGKLSPDQRRAVEGAVARYETIAISAVSL